MMHWWVSSLFWSSCAQHVDLLLTYGGEYFLGINCTNFQIWNGYWDMISPLEALSTDVDMWPNLFLNKLARTLAMRRRFSGPCVIEEARWLATDAAPKVIGAADWRD